MSTSRQSFWAITPGHSADISQLNRDVISHSLMTSKGKPHTIVTVDVSGRAIIWLGMPHKWQVRLIHEPVQFAVATQVSSKLIIAASVGLNGSFCIRKFSNRGETVLYRDDTYGQVYQGLYISQRQHGNDEDVCIRIVTTGSSTVAFYAIVIGDVEGEVVKNTVDVGQKIHCAAQVDCLSLERKGGEVLCALATGNVHVLSSASELVARFIFRSEGQEYVPVQLRNTGCGKVVMLSESSRLKIWEAGVHGATFHALADIQLDHKVVSFDYYKIGCRVDILALATSGGHIDIVVQDFSTLIEWRAFVDLAHLNSRSAEARVEWMTSTEGLMLYVCTGHRTMCYKIPVFTTFPARYKSDAIMNAANIFVRSNLGGRLLLSEVPMPVFHPHKLLQGLGKFAWLNACRWLILLFSSWRELARQGVAYSGFCEDVHLRSS